MESSTTDQGATRDRRALAIPLLGAVVGVGPVVALPFPGDGGPITFVVRLAQALLLIAGTVVAVAGVYSYRTGDLRPAVAAAAAAGSLTAVGVVGGLVETSGGPLVPVPVWLAAGSAALLASLTLPYAFVDRPRSVEPHDSDRG